MMTMINFKYDRNATQFRYLHIRSINSDVMVVAMQMFNFVWLLTVRRDETKRVKSFEQHKGLSVVMTNNIKISPVHKK